MATLTKERRPVGSIPNGNIACGTSVNEPSLISNGAQRLSSLYTFIKEFPKPVQTFKDRRQSKAAIISVEGQLTAGTDSQSFTQGPAQPDHSFDPSDARQSYPNGSKQQSSTSQPDVRPTNPVSQNVVPEPVVHGNRLLLLPSAESTVHRNDIIGNNNQQNILQTVPTPADESRSKHPPRGQVENPDHPEDKVGTGRDLTMVQASDPSSRRRVNAFAERGQNIYEAIRLRPEGYLLDQWKSSERRIVDKRLRDLHLGQNVITNLRLSMMGPNMDEESMKPTVLIICSDEKKIKDVENGLREFVRISFPDCVELKVIAGKVKLASGSVCGTPSNPGEKMDFQLYVQFENPTSLVGRAMRIAGSHLVSDYSDCTIGGIISIGNSMFGLTVGHAMFRNAKETGPLYTN